MGFITGTLIALAVGAGAVLFCKSEAEERQRRNTPCNFDNGISKEEFITIAESVCKPIKRITKFSIEGPIIKATVRSQSGISDWKFSIDFNDYGKITGRYCISGGNSDSKIPSSVAERIKEIITNSNEVD